MDLILINMKSVNMVLHVSLTGRELGIPSLLDFSSVNCSILISSSIHFILPNYTLPDFSWPECIIIDRTLLYLNVSFF